MATSSDSNRFYFETRPVTSPPILYDSVRDSPYGSDSDSPYGSDSDSGTNHRKPEHDTQHNIYFFYNLKLIEIV
jgi:hypothetical protein